MIDVVNGRCHCFVLFGKLRENLPVFNSVNDVQINVTVSYLYETLFFTLLYNSVCFFNLLHKPSAIVSKK